MNTVRINDRSMVIKGSLVIGSVNGRVLVNGEDVTPPGDAKQIIISVTGDVANLQVDNCQAITVSGSVKTLSTKNGGVTCGEVGGDVTTTNGTITCGNVQGSVSSKNGVIYKL